MSKENDESKKIKRLQGEIEGQLELFGKGVDALGATLFPTPFTYSLSYERWTNPGYNYFDEAASNPSIRALKELHTSLVKFKGSLKTLLNNLGDSAQTKQATEEVKKSYKDLVQKRQTIKEIPNKNSSLENGLAHPVWKALDVSIKVNSGFWGKIKEFVRNAALRVAKTYVKGFKLDKLAGRKLIERSLTDRLDRHVARLSKSRAQKGSGKTI